MAGETGCLRSFIALFLFNLYSELRWLPEITKWMTILLQIVSYKTERKALGCWQGKWFALRTVKVDCRDEKEKMLRYGDQKGKLGRIIWWNKSQDSGLKTQIQVLVPLIQSSSAVLYMIVISLDLIGAWAYLTEGLWK